MLSTSFSNGDSRASRAEKENPLPYRAPGSPGHSRQQFLSGKPIHYYRPKGSADIRHLIDEGFQAFNAGRLSEACAIFTEKMLDPKNDTTIGLTVAGAMTPAGLGGCVIEMMDRGLIDFVISTGSRRVPQASSDRKSTRLNSSHSQISYAVFC